MMFLRSEIVLAVHAQTSVSDLIAKWQAGDLVALDELLPQIYADLRSMAAARLASNDGHLTLQPTALVHDVFVRLLGFEGGQVESVQHLFSLAGRMMRQILVDRSRRLGAEKRGGSWIREDMIDAMQVPAPEISDLQLVDAAVDALERVEPRLARVVELRYFVGLSVVETARVLGVEDRTVYRDWALARVWLNQHLEDAWTR